MNAKHPSEPGVRRLRFGSALSIMGVALALLAGCSPLSALNAVTSSGGAERMVGLRYGGLGQLPGAAGAAGALAAPDTGPGVEAGGSKGSGSGAASVPNAVGAPGASERMRMDVYTPEGPAPPGGWPVVVFFYGGSWRTGERADYAFVGRSLAAQGVLTVVPDYRLYPEVSYPGFLEDGAAAVAQVWQQAPQWQANRQRVFVMGHSAGAYNAAMLALDARWLAPHGLRPAQLAGWIGLAGPYDFVPIINPDVKPVFHHPNTPPESQPVSWVSADSPPAWLAAGVRDDLVDPQRNTVQMGEKLKAQGVAVTVSLYPSLGHAVLVGTLAPALSFLAPVRDGVLDFVRNPQRVAGALPAQSPLAMR